MGICRHDSCGDHIYRIEERHGGLPVFSLSALDVVLTQNIDIGILGGCSGYQLEFYAAKIAGSFSFDIHSGYWS